MFECTFAPTMSPRKMVNDTAAGIEVLYLFVN